MSATKSKFLFQRPIIFVIRKTRKVNKLLFVYLSGKQTMSSGLRIFFGWIEPIIFFLIPGILGLIVPKSFYIKAFYPHYANEEIITTNPGVLFLGEGYGVILIVSAVTEMIIFYAGNIVSMNAVCIAMSIGDILHVVYATKYFCFREDKTEIKKYMVPYLQHIIPSVILFILRIIWLALNWTTIKSSKI